VPQNCTQVICYNADTAIEVFMRVLLLLCLVGCGPQLPEFGESGTHVDDVYVDLLEHWVQTMQDAGIDISRLSSPHTILEVDELELGYEGICQRDDTRWDIKMVKSAKGKYREALLWHELGHCVLDQGHWKTDNMDIMFPYIIGRSKYWEHIWDDAVARYLNVSLREQYEGMGE
jgi:hypothetical protein